MPPVGFEPTISAGERPKIYALDRAATETGQFKEEYNLKINRSVPQNVLLPYYLLLLGHI